MSQIFKKDYPKTLFFNFLSLFCELNNNQYIFSKEAFKRIKLEKKENDFCDELKNYYFPSKYHYLERDKTYKNFVTIIRQICKYHHIPFTSDIKYSKSKYEIKYFIYQDL
jgi:hypothetical protein|tara:strand:+ start:206 stop:535 length:330 start_codon:yes stop_codon:yes gene_type:complete